MWDVLRLHSQAMSLLRRCRVNAALTIQLFSQLFHFINMIIFNKLVKTSHLCTAKWAWRLRYRLAKIESWAEKQGLELAADCHLAKIQQALLLLQARKESHEDMHNIAKNCYKLNSIQIHVLLNSCYHHDQDDIDQALIQEMVAYVQENNDGDIIYANKELSLEEDHELHVPFLLPIDGYTCDQAQGVPKGLREFIEPLACIHNACDFELNKLVPSDQGWTEYFQQNSEMPPDMTNEIENPSQEYETAFNNSIIEVELIKSGGSLGLSILRATSNITGESGVYIKDVVQNSIAAHDGRLEKGDRILSVDGNSLNGLSQQQAAQLLVNATERVCLLISKQAAFQDGTHVHLQSDVTKNHGVHHSPNYNENASSVSPQFHSNVNQSPGYDRIPEDLYNGRERLSSPPNKPLPEPEPVKVEKPKEKVKPKKKINYQGVTDQQKQWQMELENMREDEIAELEGQAELSDIDKVRLKQLLEDREYANQLRDEQQSNDDNIEQIMDKI